MDLLAVDKVNKFENVVLVLSLRLHAYIHASDGGLCEQLMHVQLYNFSTPRSKSTRTLTKRDADESDC